MGSERTLRPLFRDLLIGNPPRHPTFDIPVLRETRNGADLRLGIWTFTYPVNVASSNWKTLPGYFDAGRRQWKYSNSASAVLTFLALLAISLAVALDDGAPQYRSSGAHGQAITMCR